MWITFACVSNCTYTMAAAVIFSELSKHMSQVSFASRKIQAWKTIIRGYFLDRRFIRFASQSMHVCTILQGTYICNALSPCGRTNYPVSYPSAVSRSITVINFRVHFSPQVGRLATFCSWVAMSMPLVQLSAWNRAWNEGFEAQELANKLTEFAWKC